MSLISKLPAPVQTVSEPRVASTATFLSNSMVVATSNAPPYGHRKGWVPRRQEDFGDGGAFPEILVAQYPLGMGQQKNDSNALTMQLDSQGKIRYDAIVKQGHSKDRIVYSKFQDLLPKVIDEDDPALQKPSEEDIIETANKTREALEKMVAQKISAAAPVKRAEKLAPVQYVRYTPAQQGTAFNSGAKQRIVRMMEAQKDPMEPPRFKINKKIPRGPPSPPPPVMHSPTRKVSVKEQAEWKIPPCISNWKNPRGYTIPLDKRVAADGRGLQTVHINENFAKLAESLYIADRKAREAIEKRAQIDRQMAQREKEKREEDLQRIAREARESRAGIRRVDQAGPSRGDVDSAKDRDELRKDRARERARDRNLARAGAETRTKVQREKERDISEKIALGMPNTRGGGVESQFDHRLFNQQSGMDSGFAGGEDELYNVYDQPWRKERDAASHIYRPTKQKDSDIYGGDLDTIISKRRFVPDKEFSGTDSGRRLDGPVQFEKEEEDPFNLNKFFHEAKRAEKRPNEESSSRAGASGSSRKRDRRD